MIFFGLLLFDILPTSYDLKFFIQKASKYWLKAFIKILNLEIDFLP